MKDNPMWHSRMLPLLAVSLLTTSGCESSTQLPLRLVFPEDTTDLERADNVALVLYPDGLNVSAPVEGTTFSVEVELEPDGQYRVVDLYLADGDDLLAWGRSPEFALEWAPETVSMFVGRPGALSTFPGTLENADPNVLAATALGRGFVVVGSGGETFLFNHTTLELVAGETLEPEGGLPDPSDGALVPDASGGIVRLAWADGLRAWRFSPSANTWTELEFIGGDVELEVPRPGAAFLQNTPLTRVLVLGGGERREVVAVELTAEDEPDTRRVTTIEDTLLDDPRQGAQASWLIRERDGIDEWIVLAGGSAPELPGVLAIPSDGGTPVAVGPTGTWHHARCQQIDLDATAASTVRMLCAGGMRDNTATAGGLELEFSPASAPTAVWRDDLLPLAMEDPMWFTDERALYAQGDSHLVVIERNTLLATDKPSPVARTRGGHSVNLSTGATFLLGGETLDGRAVDHWHVFMPEPL